MPITTAPIIYRCAQITDIANVYALEQLIEGHNAASLNTLTQRFNMHPQGFLLAYSKKTLVGYLQSCIWQRPTFETFEQIKNFSALHTEDGNEAYVVFLGVHPDYRRQGIATNLLRQIDTRAAMYALQTISLVAKENLIPLYKKSNFKIIRPLPDFLPNSEHTLMRKTLKFS